MTSEEKEYQKLFNELYQYEKQGVYMEMEGSPASPTQIVRAHMLREIRDICGIMCLMKMVTLKSCIFIRLLIRKRKYPLTNS